MLTARPSGTFSAEVRVWDGDTSFPEVGADICRTEGVSHAAFLCHFFEQQIRFPKFGVSGNAEHSFRRFIMRTKHIAPFDILTPCRGGKGFVGGHFKHVGITETASAHTCAVQDHHTFEDADLQNTMRAQSGKPNIFPILPIGFGEIFIFESFTFFKNKNRVALLG